MGEEQKNKYNILPGLMILISTILWIPSIQYMIKNKTIVRYTSYYSYFLKPYQGRVNGLLEGIIVISLLLTFSALYFLIVKKEKEIFKTKKGVAVFIIIISLIFTMTLPLFSSDIFYYIGDSWLATKYKQNPYYTTVKDLQDNGINDEILNKTGYWRNTTSVYGPLWNSIAFCLSSLSFGNVTVAFFIYKMVACIVHIINCYFIYAISKRTKNVLLYGLNPLVLINFLCDVHNDMYLILFLLIAIYFLLKNKNIFGFIFFLSLSIATKYTTALLVPFLLIYYFKDKPNFLKRTIACILSGFTIIGIVILLFIPYYNDITVFTNMLAHNTRYSQSITAFLILHSSPIIVSSIKYCTMSVFVTIYIISIIKLLCKRNIELQEIFDRANILMFIFIFFVLTMFQPWYVLWVVPTIAYSSTDIKKFFYILTITGFMPSLTYFIVGGDPFGPGATYSLLMLLIATFGYMYIKYTKEYKKEEGLQE